MSRKFLLCFHDFSVWNYRKVTPILEELRDLAGVPFSVLVIPDTEKAPSDMVKGFRETLQKLKADGFELALHGYKHQAEFSQGRSYAGLIGMNLTGGEAEFAGLSEFESSRLLHLGLDAWKDLTGDSEKPADNKCIRYLFHANSCLIDGMSVPTSLVYSSHGWSETSSL